MLAVEILQENSLKKTKYLKLLKWKNEESKQFIQFTVGIRIKSIKIKSEITKEDFFNSPLSLSSIFAFAFTLIGILQWIGLFW